ncbi:hypothetical protein D3C73_671390 [compost metagenome]
MIITDSSYLQRVPRCIGIRAVIACLRIYQYSNLIISWSVAELIDHYIFLQGNIRN